MKKLCIALAGIVCMAFCCTVPVRAAEPLTLHSYAAVLMDASTGQILFEKNANQLMYPASTTKIMTGLLVAEYAPTYQIITVSETAVDIEEPDSANISLKPGEQLSVNEAMYGMMLASGNDAANALAEHVAGSQQEFARRMTQKAHDIGAVHTQFVNAHGLDEEGHCTTARDLAIITRYAIANPTFLKYFGAAEYTMAGTNTHPAERTFTNYQSMLIDSSTYYNSEVIGGKIGFTDFAQHAMSTVATRNGRTLVAVVLFSQNREHKYIDTQKLLDYGFGNFQKITVPKEDFSDFVIPLFDSGMPAGMVSFSAEKDFSALIPKGTDPANVQIQLDRPDSFQMRDTISLSAGFALTGDFDPIPLGSVPLTSHIMLDRSALFPSAGIQTQTGPQRPSLGLPLLLVILLLLAALLFARRQYTLAKRQRERQKRRERLHREYYGIPSASTR